MARQAGIAHAAARLPGRSQRCAEGQGVRRAHVEKQAAQQACEDGGGDHSDGDSGSAQPHSLCEHQAEDLGALRSDRLPDADFRCALGDSVRHHAIQPDDGENQRDGSEAGDQIHRFAPLRERRLHDFLHRADGGDGLIAVDGRHHCGERLRERAWLAIRAQGNRNALPGPLRIGGVDRHR